MLQFAWPWSICALIAPLLVARGLPPAAPWGSALRVPFFATIAAWSAASGGSPDWRRALWPLVAWTALVCASCRPQWVQEPVGIPVSGRSLVLALDISASMRAAHLGSEMAMAVVRRVAAAFVAGRRGDRVALVLFGTRPYLQAPLTFDRRAVQHMVNEASIGLAGDGTAIGDAIGLAIRTTRDLEATARVLILLTDGANTGGLMEPLEAARMARASGLRIYTIGVGAAASSEPGDQLDEGTLQAVAERTGGRYFRAEDPETLAAVYASLDRLEPTAKGEQRLRPIVEMFHWPLTLALLTAALAAVTRLAGRPR